MKAYIERTKSVILTISPFDELNYERTYSFTSLSLMFFFFSFTGWIWEVLIHIIEDGAIINRGLLFGPWLPIYGFGGVLILTLLRRWRYSPLKTFGLIVLLCGVIEYATSVALERLFHARWWDYSDLTFNLNGRVCLEGLMIFGIGGLVFIYFVAPKLDDFLKRFGTRGRLICSLCLIAVFSLDLVHAFMAPNMGFGITS